MNRVEFCEYILKNFESTKLDENILNKIYFSALSDEDTIRKLEVLVEFGIIHSEERFLRIAIGEIK